MKNAAFNTLTIALMTLLTGGLFACSDLDENTQGQVEEKERWNRAMRWRAANWNLLLLLQKTVIAAAWVLLLTVCIVTAEAEAWGSSSEWSWVVPLYVVAGVRVVNSILCQNLPMVEILSWLSVAVFLVFYNLRVTTNSLELDWVEVMIPLNVLLGVWSLTTLYLIVEYIYGAILLKTRQVEALGLYLPSFSCLLVAINSYDSQRDDKDSTHPTPALLATIGTMLLFMGLHISVAEAVETMITRKGSSRPTPVSSSPRGVEPDLNKAYRYNLLIGEYDTPASIQLSDSNRHNANSYADSLHYVIPVCPAARSDPPPAEYRPAGLHG